MTGLCVSGRPLSAGDVSIKVTEHRPHLLGEDSGGIAGNPRPAESPSLSRELIFKSSLLILEERRWN